MFMSIAHCMDKIKQMLFQVCQGIMFMPSVPDKSQ